MISRKIKKLQKLKRIVKYLNVKNQKERTQNLSIVFIVDAHFTSGGLASLKDAQSMKVISAPNVNGRFKHTFTMHRQEQGTTHITTTPKHALIPPNAVNEKNQ